ncbi:MAG: hypothetical protein L3J95_06350 [Thermoplasmata archaeon]|nr:hypothetical protein [Thermoplasmata archaeon]MCI4360015.1 hypothetical protein [Thermoplasmata archaeon]
MAASAETLEGPNRIERYTRYIDIVDSLVPPSNSSWYCPPELPGGPLQSPRLKERDMVRKIRAVNGRHP